MGLRVTGAAGSHAGPALTMLEAICYDTHYCFRIPIQITKLFEEISINDPNREFTYQ